MKDVKSVKSDECDLINVEDASIVVMIKVKEIDTISNMYHVCRNKGFNDIKIHHIEAMDNLLRSSPSFVVDERMILIKICGLPLCAWGSSAFKKVHVVEEKEVKKTPPKDPKAEDSKPPGFKKGPIYNNDDVTSRVGNEDVSFSTDQVKDNHIVTYKDMAADEVVSDNSKPPGFENVIKDNKDCSLSSSTL
ncbi:hypothetical protein Tco_0945515 [Tanacetum coccineum]